MLVLILIIANVFAAVVMIDMYSYRAETKVEEDSF